MAFVVPGTGLLTAGGIGTALLLRKAFGVLDAYNGFKNPRYGLVV